MDLRRSPRGNRFERILFNHVNGFGLAGVCIVVLFLYQYAILQVTSIRTSINRADSRKIRSTTRKSTVLRLVMRSIPSSFPPSPPRIPPRPPSHSFSAAPLLLDRQRRPSLLLPVSTDTPFLRDDRVE